MLPGGLKPGLGPLRGPVLKDMTWDPSFETSRGAFVRSTGAALPFLPSCVPESSFALRSS